jgi:FkbM family methyltransferase
MNANQQLNMKRPAEEMLASTIFGLASFYTRHSPIRKGKGFLMELVLNSGLPRHSCWTRSADGRLFEFDSTTRLGHQIYFFGARERAETRLVREFIKPGDTAFDIGANIGWYTTLLSRLVGGKGSVYAFEPVPRTFESLGRTVEKNRCEDNVRLFNNLVGAEPGSGLIYEFPGLHPGLSSSRPLGGAEKIEHRIDKITIDDAVDAYDVSAIDFLKIDVEGAEFEVLKGAARSLRTGTIKTILIEVNEERAAAFGYRFQEYIELVAGSNDYSFYRVLPDQPGISRIETPLDIRNGDNLIAILESSDKAKLIEPLVKV